MTDATTHATAQHRQGNRRSVIDVGSVAVPVSDQDRASGSSSRPWASRSASTGRPGTVAAGCRSPVRAASSRSRWWPRRRVRGGVDSGITFATSDAAADHEALTGRGVDTDELLRWPGVPVMFAFRDPDGNRFKMMEAS